MTWAEFKKRCEELGAEDNDQTGIREVTEDGVAIFESYTFAIHRAGCLFLKENLNVRKATRD